MRFNITSDNVVLQKYNEETQKMLKDWKKKHGKLLIALAGKVAHHYEGLNADWHRIGDKRMQDYLKFQV